MDDRKYVGLMELSRLVGVAYWKIVYAHKSGAVPKPEPIVGTLAYAPEDVERINRYFAAKKKPSKVA